MRPYILSLALACAVLPAVAAPKATAALPNITPTYTADGKLQLPSTYREWIFLSSGIDMTYTPANPSAAAIPAAHSSFENVFVNPTAYRAFLDTGTWPDKTVLVLEIRGAETDASINKAGKTQGSNINGIEVHVKDTARFPSGGWAFFAVDQSTHTGKLIPQPASCYTCHQQHAAVDTTFTQFYPTLLPIAKSRATLSPAYLQEIRETKEIGPTKPPAPSAAP